jgi:hypothetical protein
MSVQLIDSTAVIEINEICGIQVIIFVVHWRAVLSALWALIEKRIHMKAIQRCLAMASGFALVATLFALPASAQCPAYGADSTCGVVITITDTGTTVTQTGQGPYDGNDDTLVGIVNNSTKRTIPLVVLSSAADIFAFDGDGVDAYGAPGNALDTTGYGGPNSYFTNISADFTSGTVKFVTPLAPGQSTYFSLENNLATAYSCTDLINNAVQQQASGANICAVFTPKMGATLQAAAQACGFTNFDWVQPITRQNDPSPFFARNLGMAFKAVAGSVRLTSATVPWSDPPQGGGYAQGGGGGATPDFSYPFYYDPAVDLPGAQDGSTPAACTLPVAGAGLALTFHDAPADPCLPGGIANGTAKCLGSKQPAGSFGGYTTHLAGVNSDGTAKDLGIGFTWTSNYNGTTGGVVIAKTNLPADDNGTGGVTITSTSPTTNYNYQGLNVLTETSSLLSGQQVVAVVEGPTYCPVHHLYEATLLLRNISGATITGPVQVVLNSLSSGATLTNGNGTFGGFPYITAGNSATLAPGETIKVPLTFNDPSHGSITFTPLSYTGSLN